MVSSDLEQDRRWTSSQLLLISLLQLVLVYIAYRTDASKRAPYFSTASWAILFGMTFGVVLSLLMKNKASGMGLDPKLFFFGLLPPILLDAGFNIEGKRFFSNLWAIALLALGGTLVATIVTGILTVWLGHMLLQPIVLKPAEALLYGSLISAIDPVATLIVMRKTHAPAVLVNLLAGESVVNDAVSISMFSIFQHAVLHEETSPLTWQKSMEMAGELLGIAFGSVVLTAAICYASAFLLRFADETLKQHPRYEISTLLLSSYTCYVAGESFELSGALAVFFSGIFIHHYHRHNISKSSARTFTRLLGTMSLLAENFIYIYLGISLIAYSDAFYWDWTFIGTSFAICLVARAASTFPLCMLMNFCRTKRIPFRYMLVIWFAGLRGAVAFALALNVRTVGDSDHAAVIRASTLFTVIFTTLVFGMMTAPLLRVLRLNHDDSLRRHSTLNEITLLLFTNDAVAEHFSIRDTWIRFDNKYLKPVFGGRRPGSTERDANDTPTL